MTAVSFFLLEYNCFTRLSAHKFKVETSGSAACIRIPLPLDPLITPIPPTGSAQSTQLSFLCSRPLPLAGYSYMEVCWLVNPDLPGCPTRLSSLCLYVHSLTVQVSIPVCS